MKKITAHTPDGTAHTFTVTDDAVTVTGKPGDAHATKADADAVWARIGRDPAVSVVASDDGKAWTLAYPPAPRR